MPARVARRSVSSSPRRVSCQTYAGTLRFSSIIVSTRPLATGRASAPETNSSTNSRGTGSETLDGLPHTGHRRLVLERAGYADQHGPDPVGMAARDHPGGHAAARGRDEHGAVDGDGVQEGDEVGGVVLGRVALGRAVGVAMAALGGRVTAQGGRKAPEEGFEKAHQESPSPCTKTTGVPLG